MATITPSFVSLHSPTFHHRVNNSRLPYYSNLIQRKYRKRTKPVSLTIVNSVPEVKKEEIVIIGAGIAGLATAVSLHRLGVRSVVIEQADSLRTGGTSLTLFKNGWRVLDAIGIGNELRPQFLEIQGREDYIKMMDCYF